MGSGHSKEKFTEKFTEIKNELCRVVGISTKCEIVHYKLGDKVVIKLPNGKKTVEVKKIANLDDSENQIFYTEPDARIDAKIAMNDIIKKYNENSSIVDQNRAIVDKNRNLDTFYNGRHMNGNEVLSFSTECGYVEYVIGDIVSYKYENEDESIKILKILAIDEKQKKIILGDLTGKELDSISYDNIKEIKPSITELVIPDPYSMGSTVSFIDSNGPKVVGVVNGNGNVDQNGIVQSHVMVLDRSGVNHKVILPNDTLKKVIRLEDEYRVKYAKYKSKYLLLKKS